MAANFDTSTIYGQPPPDPAGRGYVVKLSYERRFLAILPEHISNRQPSWLVF